MGSKEVSDEQNQLEAVAGWYSALQGFEKLRIEHELETILDWCQGRNALEVGCADGLTTARIAEKFDRIVVVEAVGNYIDATRRRLDERADKVQFQRTLFEEFSSTERFDTIFLLSILEHVSKPQIILMKAKSMMSENGILLAAVPNAESLHRRVGVSMGILGDCHDFSRSDLRIGHKRVYDSESFRRELSSAGLKIEFMKGIGVKPLSNAQMERLGTDTAEAILKLDEELPGKYCSMLFAKCRIVK